MGNAIDQINKEIYFKQAQQQIEAAGFQDFLSVDRSKFGIIGDRLIKVYTKPIHHKRNMQMWWKAKREINNFEEQFTLKDQYGRRKSSIYLVGFIKINMKENSE